VPIITLALVAMLGGAIHVLIERGEKQRLRRVEGRIRRVIAWKPRLIQGGKIEATTALPVTEAEEAEEEQTTGTEG
jgi:hypothetical protein